MPTSTVPAKSSPLLIAAAWLLVVLPAAWGLNYTVRNALKIFTPNAAAPATTPK
jgi:hypothetical protein